MPLRRLDVTYTGWCISMHQHGLLREREKCALRQVCDFPGPVQRAWTDPECTQDCTLVHLVGRGLIRCLDIKADLAGI